MDKTNLLNKAVYIQYPISYTSYKNYGISNILKLPLAPPNMMYDKWYLNHNHFTTEYHRKYSLPLLKEVLGIPYNEGDFILKERNFDGFDISMLYPKKEFKYEIFGFNRDEHFDDISYNELLQNDSTKSGITGYHRLYKYSHENSRIINKTISSDEKLFISGDSQMIPDLGVLSCYFKEIWYMDNRDNLTLNNKWKDIDFTKVLIEVNDNVLNQYININLQ